MEFTIKEQLKNIDERINQYILLIKMTIEDITELLKKRNELINKIDN